MKVTGKVPRTDRLLTAEFFALAKARLSLDAPKRLTDPHFIPSHGDHDADPAVMAAIAAVRPTGRGAGANHRTRRAERVVHSAHSTSCRPPRTDFVSRRK